MRAGLWRSRVGVRDEAGGAGDKAGRQVEVDQARRWRRNDGDAERQGEQAGAALVLFEQWNQRRYAGRRGARAFRAVG